MSKSKFLLCFFLFFQSPIFSSYHQNNYSSLCLTCNPNIKCSADGTYNQYLEHRECQYRTLGEHQKVFLTECPKAAKKNPIKWQKYVNNHFNEIDSLSISFSCSFSTYKMPKQELLNSNYETVNLIYTTTNPDRDQLRVFSKETLHSLYNLTEKVLQSLEGGFQYHYKHYDKRIKFRYKKKLNLARVGKTIIKNYAIFTSLLIPTILSTYDFLPQKNRWELIQPPSLLAENKKKEFTNEIIKNLCKEKQINDELILLHTIASVEFKWIFLPNDNQLRYYLDKMCTKIFLFLIHYGLSTLFNKKIFNIMSKSNNYKPDCDTNKYQPEDRHYSFFTLYNCLLLTIGIFGEQLTSLIFAQGTLMGFIITGCLPFILSIIQTTIELYEYHNKTIDYYKKKFKKPSNTNGQWTFKKILEYYFNKEDIVIL